MLTSIENLMSDTVLSDKTVSEDKILQRSKELYMKMAKAYPDLISGDLVNIRISKRMTRSAGYYNVKKKEIVLSYPYFKKRQYFEKMLPKVIAHEVAHSLVNLKQEEKKTDIHSDEWKNISIRLGGDGSVLHQMQLPDAKEAFCDCCNRLIKLSPRRFKWWIEGKRTYCHRNGECVNTNKFGQQNDTDEP